MENKDIRNYAGVGYMQGVLSEYLTKEGHPHNVKVDGMFGVETYLGLNIASNDMINLMVSDEINPTYNWNNGIRIFQDWYKTIYDQVSLDRKLRGWVNNFPEPETDGLWGINTKLCFDYIMRYK